MSLEFLMFDQREKLFYKASFLRKVHNVLLKFYRILILSLEF